MRIDVHAHHFPSEYMDCLARLGHPDARAAVLRAPGGGMSLDDRMVMLDRTGVDLQVLSPAAAAPYLAEEANAVEAARTLNDGLIAVRQQYPGRFAAFASLPLPHVDAALAELRRGLDTLGMVGVTVGCSVLGRQLDDPAFEPLYAELDRRATVLFLHPVGAGCGAGSAEYGIRWMVGAPVEDAVAALRLTLSGLTTRYPNVKVIVPHFGGMLPFLLERLDDEAEREGHAGIRPAPGIRPSEVVKRLYYDTVNAHVPALRCACETFGADRIMLGTDFPYLAGARFERAVSYIAEAGLRADEVEAIYSGNAQRLLGL
jgi:predicted TIM-barrel fold metal-dependent hydrolase